MELEIICVILCITACLQSLLLLDILFDDDFESWSKKRLFCKKFGIVKLQYEKQNKEAMEKLKTTSEELTKLFDEKMQLLDKLSYLENELKKAENCLIELKHANFPNKEKIDKWQNKKLDISIKLYNLDTYLTVRNKEIKERIRILKSYK